MVPSLNHTFPGKVARFSVDVQEDTRTMHTEVDVQNPGRVLLPGLYAEATITLEKKANALAVPIQAVNQGDRNTVYVVTPCEQDRDPSRDSRHSDRQRCRGPFRIAGRRFDCGQRPQRAEGRPGCAAEGDRTGSIPGARNRRNNEVRGT